MREKNMSLNDRLNRVCGGGNLDEVKRLLSQGVDINVQNKFGITALMIASKFGHLDVVQCLIEAPLARTEGA